MLDKDIVYLIVDVKNGAKTMDKQILLKGNTS